MADSRSEHEIRVLSFNVWGLRFISKDRAPRMRAIAQYLSEQDFDVVCLQEIWMRQDYELIKREVEAVLPNGRFFRTGALGSGLAILTRFPILSTRTLPYSLSGLPLHVAAGDFFVNKAAASCVLRHPLLGELEVWNTHMHAAGDGGPETNRAHRLTQAWELAREVKAGAERGKYEIACGDFNSLPPTLPMAILRKQSLLADSFLVINPPSPITLSTPPSDPLEAIQTLGVTCDSPLNSYSAGKPLTGEAIKWKGKRLDYILFRGPEMARKRSMRAFSGSNESSRKDSNQEAEQDHSSSTAHLEEGQQQPSSMTAPSHLRCIRSEVLLTELVPGKKFSYSDHFPLLSVFVVESSMRGGYPVDRADMSQHRPLLGQGLESTAGSGRNRGVRGEEGHLTSINTDSDSRSNKYSSPPTPVNVPTNSSIPELTKLEVLSSSLQILHDYSLIARRTSRLHLRLFYASILLGLALTISSAWQPKSYIQPIWTLLGVAAGAVGATMLYVGFVWGRWERNLLEEVMEEMEMEMTNCKMEDAARRS